ncbi:hypothetical protein LguiB_011081 [Lonicera macranthoides]
MSVNQSRVEKNEPLQYRKSGRSGNSGHQRNSQGSTGKGGGTAPPSSLSSNRSYKKSNNNAQAGQSRVSGGIVNSDSNKASPAGAVQNGAHSQPPLPGVANAPVTGFTVRPTDVSMQKNTRGVPKAPSSGVTPVGSETLWPLTPGKGLGDASHSLPLQFGSIRPDFINGMQIPARTSSAPPNFDEQKRDQGRHDLSKATSTLSTPTGPPQQLLKKDLGAVDQSNNAEAQQISKDKRDVQVSVGPTVIQTPKHSIHPTSGISMQVPFHQPQVPVQFGTPNPQMQGQGLTNTSLPMPMPMPMPVPVPVGNPSQVQQQVFVPGLHPHPMQSQGLMHQGQNLNFPSQMGPQMPQLGNLGINIGPQFQQQQAGKFAIPRKTVKITHPDTHEELRLDKRTDTYMDGGSSAPRPTHHMPPQSQPITSYPPAHPINYYPNSYNPGSLFFPPQSSLPLTSTQVIPSSQAPRFYNQATQGPPPPVAFMNPSSLNSFTANKTGAPLHGIGEPSILEHGRGDGYNVISLPQSSSVQVTVKPPISSHGEKVSDSSISRGSPAVKKDNSPKIHRPNGDSNPISPKIHKASASAAGSVSAETANSLSSVPTEVSTSVVSGSSEGTRRELITRSNSIKDEQKKPGKKGLSLQQNEVGGQPTSASSFPSQSLEHGNSVNSGTCISVDTIITPASSGTSGVAQESTGVPVQIADSTGVGAEITVDTSSVNEPPKNETAGAKEEVEIMMPEETRQDENSSEINPESVPLNSLEPVNQTKQISDLKVTTSINETKSLESAERNLDEPINVGNLVTSGSTAEDSLNADKSFTSDASLSKCDGEGEGTESTNTVPLSPSASASKDNKPLLESNKSKNTMGKWKKKKKEILQKADAAGTTFDLYNAYKGPEEKKASVPSAENTESISSKPAPAVFPWEDVVSNEKSSQSKAELDDWEDAADISTPKLGSPNNGKQNGTGLLAKKYSRDFLMKFSEQCINLPEGFQITPDTAEAFVVSNLNISRDYPSPGRIIDRPTGGSRLDRRGSGMGDDDKWNKMPGPLAPGRDMRMDMGYGGNVVGFRLGQGGNYGVLRNPRGQGSVQYAGGILSGSMQSPGSQGRNNADSDRWQRATGYQKGLIPSPHTPLQVMHKAEKKYEVGKITDEEQAKQRLLKGILNKLTPQNFEKLFEQVKQVNIDNAGTLTGVISQIFDKALMEPTFCEMYANFCYYLAGELPDFNEDNEKITFKRLLLNKCQEEFERGEREQEEANRTEEEGEAKQTEEEREEKRIQARRRMLGNIRLIGELYKKKMLTERIMHECIKKLLGQYQNPDEEDVEALCKLMSTIGEIIDHPKAKEHMDVYFDMMAKLSNNMKLSSRVRFMLKDAIDLRKNKWQQRRKVEGPKKIEEVHRDAAQERQAQASRLARGPSMGSSGRRGQPMDFAPRGSNILSSPNSQMGGYRNLPQQLRVYNTQDVRSDERHTFDNRVLSVPLPQKPMRDDSITLGPQGGLARGMSSRGQPSVHNIPLADMPSPLDSRRVTAGLNGYGSRDDVISRNVPERFMGPSAYDQSSTQERNMNYVNRDVKNLDRSFNKSMPTSPTTRCQGPTLVQNVPLEKVWPEDRLRDMSIEAIKEFYSAKDEKEVALCIKDLNAPSFYPTMISIWVNDSFERKDMERDLMTKLLINLTKSQDGMLSPDQLIKGFESVLATLEDTVNDAPKAAEFLGRIFAKVIIENVIPVTEIGRLIYKGGEEEGRLVEIGLAAEVLGSTLEIIKNEKGEAALNEIHGGSNLRLEKFRPSDSKKTLRLDKFI